jgi:archaellum component FlaC
VLDLVFRPLRFALSVGERAISKPLAETEHELTVIVDAIHRTADSIEHHVEVIEGLATSVEPLKDSVNDLTATMTELVALMAPMASAEHGMRNVEHGVHEVEHGVHRVERFFGIHRHATASPAPATKQLEPDAEADEPEGAT